MLVLQIMLQDFETAITVCLREYEGMPSGLREIGLPG